MNYKKPAPIMNKQNSDYARGCYVTDKIERNIDKLTPLQQKVKKMSICEFKQWLGKPIGQTPKLF